MTWRWKPGDAISRACSRRSGRRSATTTPRTWRPARSPSPGETIGTVARTSQKRRQRQPFGGHVARPHDGTYGAEAEPEPSTGWSCSAPSCAACWIRACVHGSGPRLPGAVVCESPAPEFLLYRLTLTGEQTELPANSARIALCADGGALLRDAGGAELKTPRERIVLPARRRRYGDRDRRGGHLRRDRRLSYAAGVPAVEGTYTDHISAVDNA